MCCVRLCVLLLFGAIYWSRQLRVFRCLTLLLYLFILRKSVVSLLALLQLHLHSQLNTWLQWFGQRQLQDETRNFQVLELGVAYIRGLTVQYFELIKDNPCLTLMGELWGVLSAFGRNLLCATNTLSVHICFFFISIFLRHFQNPFWLLWTRCQVASTPLQSKWSNWRQCCRSHLYFRTSFLVRWGHKSAGDQTFRMWQTHWPC